MSILKANRQCYVYIFYIVTCVRHRDLNPSSTVYIHSLSFLSYGQPDDDRIWSKHVPDL